MFKHVRICLCSKEYGVHELRIVVESGDPEFAQRDPPTGLSYTCVYVRVYMYFRFAARSLHRELPTLSATTVWLRAG